MRCPKCGEDVVPVKANYHMYCPNDGTQLTRTEYIPTTPLGHVVPVEVPIDSPPAGDNKI